MEPEKASTKENKNVDEFATKTSKHDSLFWILKFELEIWIVNVTNQMIVFSAFIQSGFRGMRYRFSI